MRRLLLLCALLLPAAALADPPQPSLHYPFDDLTASGESVEANATGLDLAFADATQDTGQDLGAWLGGSWDSGSAFHGDGWEDHAWHAADAAFEPAGFTSRPETGTAEAIVLSFLGQQVAVVS